MMEVDGSNAEESTTTMKNQHQGNGKGHVLDEGPSSARGSEASPEQAPPATPSTTQGKSKINMTYQELEDFTEFGGGDDDGQIVEMLDVTVDVSSSDENSSSKNNNHHNKALTSAIHQSMICKSYTMAAFMLLIGVAASVSFLVLGIASATKEEAEQFNRRATELAQELESSWRDYQTAGLWIHEACRSRNLTRAQFRAVYEYVRSDGLEFQAAEFIPNVTRDEREAYENEARLFYKTHYPEIEVYHGFRGLEPDPENPGEVKLQNRSQQPFYFPVHYVEPVLPNAAAIDFDLYSSASRRSTIEAALSTWLPTLTRRLQLVQETDPSAYSVLLMHPGIRLENQDEDDAKARDVSLMVIRIPSLLERTVREFRKERLAVHLFDSTDADAPPQFLGAVQVQPSNNASDNYDPLVSTIPEMNYTDLSNRSHPGNLYFERVIEIASARWNIVVVPAEGEYHAVLGYVILGGGVLLAATLAVAAFQVHSVRRAVKMQKIIDKADAENRIVSSLFPSAVRDRLIEDAAMSQKKNNEAAAAANAAAAAANAGGGPRVARKSIVPFDSPECISSAGVYGSQPIAELYPDVTIGFGDLVGFTAWSSAREPAQVFTLLETVYHSFDRITKKLGVFKVETVGDCYVAVAGLPEPRPDHATAVCKFATLCVAEMNRVVHALEPVLGPETGDLQIRFGLHSGQVTAGVLRGLKGRFQLFGDTMNTASRLESSGQAGRIHISQETANQLIADGKGNWITPREKTVAVKGKGVLQTYWVNVRIGGGGSGGDSDDADSNAGRQQSAENRLAAANKPSSGGEMRAGVNGPNNKNNRNAVIQRLVNWNVQILTQYLKKIVARRKATGKQPGPIDTNKILNGGTTGNNKKRGLRSTPMDEVQDIIRMPAYEDVETTVDPDSIALGEAVEKELNSYVMVIGQMYLENPFHNFEHASHVTMSVVKLLSRIIRPSDGKGNKESKQNDADLHDNTYGIATDALVQFTCVFAALVHDVDHPGVPNSTLVKERRNLALTFNEKSVAEQNSIELAWDLLMSDEYTNLRQAIACDQEEFLRFRQLLINIVLATDVMDKEIGALRKKRWAKAFAAPSPNGILGDVVSMSSSSQADGVHRKATIVIEHLIQASDVAHTMQHWHIFAKWNEHLFHEMSLAYRQGRLDQDPAVGWYKGEIGFLDFYVIPLAKKLETCGVFGVSSQEYLNYAQRNREEWEQKGLQMVEQFKRSFQEKYSDQIEGSSSSGEGGREDSEISA